MKSDERAVDWRQVLRNPYRPDWHNSYSITVSREWAERLAEYLERLEIDAGIAYKSEANPATAEEGGTMTNDMERDTNLMNMIEAVNQKVELALYETRHGIFMDLQERASFLGKANAQIRLAKGGLSKRGIR